MDFKSESNTESSNVATSSNSVEKMSVPALILVMFLTGGIYTGFWFVKRIGSINAMKSVFKFREGIFAFIIAGFAVNVSLLLYVIFQDAALTEELRQTLLRASDVLALVLQVSVLIQCFKVRRVFMDHFNENLKKEIKFSWPATFFFGIFYLQYKINRL
ncbi:MAG TPA: hypothetical protein VFF54_06685 [Thermodesulfobacteriota bacterium]|nr:hypothetical protein [Thermodesulfobacteriota bacterium]